MESKQKKGLIVISVMGALAVGIGAFGAHGIKPHISPELMHTFETGSRYHFYHVLAMMVTYLLWLKQNRNIYLYVLRFFFIGIVLFSFSLYTLATRDLLGISSWTWLGALTPIGGIFLILGWLGLTVSAVKPST